MVELSPFEFLDRVADLVPRPRKHRHRYHGVFALNHRLRKAVTSLAIGNIGKRRGRDRWRPMTIATSFNRCLTRCLRSTSAAFERCRKRGANEAAIRPDEESLSADARKSPLKGGTQVFREPFLGPARRQHVAHRPLISSAMLAEVPLAGRSVSFLLKGTGSPSRTHP